MTRIWLKKLHKRFTRIQGLLGLSMLNQGMMRRLVWLILEISHPMEGHKSSSCGLKFFGSAVTNYLFFFGACRDELFVCLFFFWLAGVILKEQFVEIKDIVNEGP